MTVRERSTCRPANDHIVVICSDGAPSLFGAFGSLTRALEFAKGNEAPGARGAVLEFPGDGSVALVYGFDRQV
jgi:hypothetical protein